MTKKFLIGSAIAGIMMAGGIAVAAPDSHGPWGADANGDGNLTKVEMTASLDKAFAKFDTNSDGQVTKAELDAKRDARLEERFKKLDKDGNGQISLAEMKASQQDRMDKRQDRMAKRDAGDAKAGDAHRKHFRGRFHHGMHGGMLAQADANKDGVITKAEFQAKPLQMFAKMDANQDGTVTKAEREAMRDGMKKKMQGDQKPSN